MKRLIVLITLFALLMPSLAQAGGGKRDYKKEPLNVEEKLDIYSNLVLANQGMANKWELLEIVDEAQAKKRSQVEMTVGILIAVAAVPLSILLAPASPAACVVAASVGGGCSVGMTMDGALIEKSSSGVLMFRDLGPMLERREALRNKAQQGLAEGDTTEKKAEKKDKGYIKTLVRYFYDDPATALNNYILKDQELFFQMVEEDDMVIDHLDNFVTVVSADKGMFSKFSAEKLAGVNTRAMFVELANYVDLKEKTAGMGKKEARKTVRQERLARDGFDLFPKDKAGRTVVQEIRKEDKFGYKLATFEPVYNKKTGVQTKQNAKKEDKLRKKWNAVRPSL